MKSLNLSNPSSSSTPKGSAGEPEVESGSWEDSRRFDVLLVFWVRGVPPEITVEPLDSRMGTLIQTDWKQYARGRMKEMGWGAMGDGDVLLPEHSKGKAKKGRFVPWSGGNWSA